MTILHINLRLACVKNLNGGIVVKIIPDAAVIKC